MLNVGDPSLVSLTLYYFLRGSHYVQVILWWSWLTKSPSSCARLPETHPSCWWGTSLDAQENCVRKCREASNCSWAPIQRYGTLESASSYVIHEEVPILRSY